MKPSRKSVIQVALAVFMTGLLAVLLAWQEARYRLVGDCHARGGQWHGPSNRCRPVPKIYLDRGLKRT